MPKTKYEFTRNNNLRKEEGLPALTWVEYLRDHPVKKLGRPRMDESKKKPQSRPSILHLNFLPDPPRPTINRPSAKYDNQSYQSIYEKYGV